MDELTLPSFGGYLRHLRTTRTTALARPGRRLGRTPLAAAAEIGVGYLTKLEQNVAEHPSRDVVDRLANALGLEPASVQRQHLHDLAAYRPLTPPTPTPTVVISPEMIATAESLNPHLVGYVDQAWNVFYSNREYGRLYRHLNEVNNVLKWFFFVDDSRKIMIDWELEAQLTVNWFRALMVQRPDYPEFLKVLEELMKDKTFKHMWESQEIFMGRPSPYLRVRDLDEGVDLTLLAQVYPLPDPSDVLRMYQGIKTSPAASPPATAP